MRKGDRDGIADLRRKERENGGNDAVGAVVRIK
jgi:hypothetical protein